MYVCICKLNIKSLEYPCSVGVSRVNSRIRLVVTSNQLVLLVYSFSYINDFIFYYCYFSGYIYSYHLGT